MPVSEGCRANVVVEDEAEMDETEVGPEAAVEIELLREVPLLLIESILGKADWITEGGVSGVVKFDERSERGRS